MALRAGCNKIKKLCDHVSTEPRCTGRAKYKRLDLVDAPTPPSRQTKPNRPNRIWRSVSFLAYVMYLQVACHCSRWTVLCYELICIHTCTTRDPAMPHCSQNSISLYASGNYITASTCHSKTVFCQRNLSQPVFISSLPPTHEREPILWQRILTVRCYAKRGICRRRVSICVSVTLWYCIKTAKRRITQIIPHSPGTLVF